MFFYLQLQNLDAAVDRSTQLLTEGLFSPTAAWKGASARVKRSEKYPIEEQNFITIDDYNNYGPTVLHDVIVG